jgi:hypothetical protein
MMSRARLDSHKLYNPNVEDESELDEKVFTPLKNGMVRIERTSYNIRESEQRLFELMTLADARQHYLALLAKGWKKPT